MKKILHWLFGPNSLWCKLVGCEKPKPTPEPTPPMPEPWPQIVAKPGPPWFGVSLYQLPHFVFHKVDAYITKHAFLGGNVLEIFGPISWGGYELNQPYSHQPGILEPDKYPVVWNLDLYSMAWWSQISNIMMVCADTKTQLVFRFLDYCGIKQKALERKYCFRACSQRVEFPEGDPRRLTGGLYGAPIHFHFAKFLRKFTLIAKDYGIRPWYVPMNEADYLPGQGETEDQADAAVIGLHQRIIDTLSALGVQRDEIIISTSRAFRQLKEMGYRMEIHGINSPVRLNQAIDQHGTFIFPNGDGPDPYAAGQIGDGPDKRLPSYEQAEEMGSIMRRRGVDRWAGFNRGVESVSPADIDKATFEVLPGLRKGFGS